MSIDRELARRIIAYHRNSHREGYLLNVRYRQLRERCSEAVKELSKGALVLSTQDLNLITSMVECELLKAEALCGDNTPAGALYKEKGSWFLIYENGALIIATTDFERAHRANACEATVMTNFDFDDRDTAEKAARDAEKLTGLHFCVRDNGKYAVPRYELISASVPASGEG